MERRIFASICAGRIVVCVQIDLLAVQPSVERTAVVKYAVQDHADASHMRFPHEIGEQSVAGLEIGGVRHSGPVFAGLRIVFGAERKDLLRIVHYFAKMRVNVAVILRVIFVVGWRYEDGIEVDPVNAELLQVIQLVHDALQVAAVVLAGVVGRGRTVPVLDLLHAAAVVVVLAGHDVVVGVAVAEAVREDLIEHGSFGPVRRLETGRNIPPPVGGQLGLRLDLLEVCPLGKRDQAGLRGTDKGSLGGASAFAAASARAVFVLGAAVFARQCSIACMRAAPRCGVHGEFFFLFFKVSITLRADF